MNSDNGCPVNAKGRVLLMDDEKMVRDVAGELLTCLGYKVAYAKDGNEAIEVYCKAKSSGNPFDAVIMDLTIPGGMGGREAVQKLLAIDSNVKAIVSSGYAHGPIMANFKIWGFSGVLSKPYKMENIGKVLDEVLGNKANSCRA